jgi:hypothetical protein
VTKTSSRRRAASRSRAPTRSTPTHSRLTPRTRPHRSAATRAGTSARDRELASHRLTPHSARSRGTQLNQSARHTLNARGDHGAGDAVHEIGQSVSSHRRGEERRIPQSKHTARSRRAGTERRPTHQLTERQVKCTNSHAMHSDIQTTSSLSHSVSPSVSHSISHT